MSTNTIIPPFLKNGDKIAIVAPAKYIEESYIDNARKLIESWGLQCVIGKHTLGKYRVFSGTDAERAEDLQWALDHPEIKAIICARGGYGTIRIIDQLNFDRFLQKPKWIAGFSDITVLHNHIHTHQKVATLHATVPLNFPNNPESNPSLQSLRNMLFGQWPIYTTAPHSLNRPGSASAEVVGGNLSILHNLIGTNSDLNTDGKILILEEVSEYAYHFDRMMWALKKAGKLDSLAGLIVGGLTDIKQGPNPFGQEPENIILELVKDFNFPVCFNFPSGHQPENWCLPLGATAKLEVGAQVVLNYQLNGHT
jgi:muramoyltetrapeptide carboxypeptidase